MTTSTRNQAERQQQMDVLQQMTELLDSLPSREAKKEVLAFLVASVGGKYIEPASTVRSGYTQRRKTRSW